MYIIYLDTCIPFRPFQDITSHYDCGSPRLAWHQARVEKSKELITLIGRGKLKWSTSEYFFREFEGLTVVNPENSKAIANSNVLYNFLREIYKQARRAYLIKASEELEEDATELSCCSAPDNPEKQLELIDACHIIASFRAQVYRFLTYDHNSILNNHKDFIDNEGRNYNPNFNCEDPADTGFPNA